MAISSSSSSSNSGVRVLLLFAVLLMAAVTGAAIIAGDPLLPVCKTVGGGSTFFDVDFCLSALGSEGRSRNAESYRDFSAIAVDLVTANATGTAAKIDGLMKAAGGGSGEYHEALMGCLESCKAMYGDILRRQPDCASAVKDGKFGEAAASLEKSADAAKACDGGFAKNNITSPLAVEDDSTFKLAKLTVALLRFSFTGKL